MIHIYEKSYDRLYREQPEHLDYLAKHLRIDKLSCLDMQLNMPDECIKATHLTWFYALCTILNQVYLQSHPEICRMECFREITSIQLKQYLDREVSVELLLKELKQYILNRKRLITYLRGDYYGWQSQSE